MLSPITLVLLVSTKEKLRMASNHMNIKSSCSGFKIQIEPNVKLECVPKFCYLGDTLGAGGGEDEAARARVQCCLG